MYTVLDARQEARAQDIVLEVEIMKTAVVAVQQADLALVEINKK